MNSPEFDSAGRERASELIERLLRLVLTGDYDSLYGPRVPELLGVLPRWLDRDGRLLPDTPQHLRDSAKIIVAPPMQVGCELPPDIRAVTLPLLGLLFPECVRS